MKPILLIGGGGHCKSVIDVIEKNNFFEIVGIVEKKSSIIESVLSYPVIGYDCDLPQLIKKYPNVLVTLGQIKTAQPRKNIYGNLKELGAFFPSIVSSNAYVSDHSALGEGTIVMNGSIVNSGTKIGCNNIVNSMALIEHDVQIGNHCHIATGSILNGGVKIGDNCFVGSGAILKQGIKIGFNCIVGAGVLVTKDISENSLVKGRT